RAPALLSAACAEAIARAATLRLAARLPALNVLPRGCAVAGAAQRVVAIQVLRARPNVSTVRAAVLNALQALASVAAQILAGAALQRLLCLRTRGRDVTPAVRVALRTAQIGGCVAVERRVAVPSCRVAVHVEAPVHVDVVVPVHID